MDKKLTKEEIQELYDFTRRHFVEHYDLQTELVDHLANDIELIKEEQAGLTFVEARDKSFKKFGVFGFMDVVDQRQKAMSKRYVNYLWKYLKQWFELPQLLVTVSIFLMCYILFSNGLGYYFFIGSIAVIGTWSGAKGIKLNRYFEQKKEATKRMWMMEDIIFRQASCFGVAFAPVLYNISVISEKIFEYNYVVMLSSALVTFMGIYSYISFVVIPNEAENLLQKAYPEYNM